MKKHLRPPMGWNSWDCFGTSVTEAEVRANAEFMAEHLLPFGWDTVVVDIQWSEPDAQAGGYRPFAPLIMDAYGRLTPALNRFPSAAEGRGFKPLADFIHRLGLKFGIHIMRGIPRQAVNANTPIWNSSYTAQDAADTGNTCYWNTDMFGLNWSNPAAEQAAQDYYDSLLALYGSWDVDFIKADDMLHPYHADEIAGFRRAIDRCGREIILSLSPGIDLTIDNADHLIQNSELWRISPDFWDIWDDLKRQFDLCKLWSPFISDGAYPDADMIPIGHISIRGERGEDRQSRFTPDEVTTLLTLWSIFRSPLMIGCDLPTTDKATIAKLTNPEVIAVNQYSRDNRELFRRGDHIVWAAESVNSNHQYLACFNVGEHNPTLTIDLSRLGMVTGTVRDLWSRQDVGTFHHQLEVVLPPHGAALFRLQSSGA